MSLSIITLFSSCKRETATILSPSFFKKNFDDSWLVSSRNLFVSHLSLNAASCKATPLAFFSGLCFWVTQLIIDSASLVFNKSRERTFFFFTSIQQCTFGSNSIAIYDIRFRAGPVTSSNCVMLQHDGRIITEAPSLNIPNSIYGQSPAAAFACPPNSHGNNTRRLHVGNECDIDR